MFGSLFEDVPLAYIVSIIMGSLTSIAFIWYRKQTVTPSVNEGKGVSTLTNTRGSGHMGLPSQMSKATIDTIVATAPAVAPKALAITTNFYARVLKKHPQLLSFFNPAHNVPISNHQPEALANSIVAYATHIKDLSPLLVAGGPVASICHRHCALTIFPDSYAVVHENLMESIGEVLGSIVTPEIANAWSEAVLFLAKAMIDSEESIYDMAEKREGGWSGHIEFQVSEIETVATGIKAFSYKPPAGSPLEGKSFQFSTGQYLSLVVDINGDSLTAPRHYTVTSPPGADFLQYTVKQIKEGKVSTYIHQHLKVGDMLKLAAPFGVFTVEEIEFDEIEGAVLMSAGIGVTPMLNFQRALGKGNKLKLCVYVDSKPESYAHRDLFRQSKWCGPERMIEKYTRVPGRRRLSAAELVAAVLKRLEGDGTKFIFAGQRSG